MTRVYLDHNATTPVYPEVGDAVSSLLTTKFGNPSSAHAEGREARVMVDDARRQTAALIGARPSEIIFTSGGTEADNLAIMAAAGSGGHIITSSIEHHAVLDAARYLEEAGRVELTVIPVDEDGLVGPADVHAAMRSNTSLVSIMYANNEIGTIEPVEEIGALCRERDVLFHTDAVQAVGKIPLDVHALPVDLLTLSAHKFGGPKGIGALYVRRGVRLQARQHGGSQERSIRPGTENVLGAVGMGAAAERTNNGLVAEAARVTSLRDRLEKALLDAVDGVKVNGGGAIRVPNTSSLTVEGVEGPALLLSLDLEGISCSSGSACTTGAQAPSHVLTAIGLDSEAAHCTVRLAWGWTNDETDLTRVIDTLPRVVRELRELAVFER